MSRQKIRFSYFTPGPNPREAADKGVGAEKLGIDCVWVSDHLTDMPPVSAVFDAWTMLGDIGARTTTIGRDRHSEDTPCQGRRHDSDLGSSNEWSRQSGHRGRGGHEHPALWDTLRAPRRSGQPAQRIAGSDEAPVGLFHRQSGQLFRGALSPRGRPSLFAAGPEAPSAHLYRRIHVDEAVQHHWRDVPGLAVGQSEYGGLLQEKGLRDEQGG